MDLCVGLGKEADLVLRRSILAARADDLNTHLFGGEPDNFFLEPVAQFRCDDRVRDVVADLGYGIGCRIGGTRNEEAYVLQSLNFLQYRWHRAGQQCTVSQFGKFHFKLFPLLGT